MLDHRYYPSHHFGEPEGYCRQNWASDFLECNVGYGHYENLVDTRQERFEYTQQTPKACSIRDNHLPYHKNAPYPEGNVFEKVGELFEEQMNFPAGITFAPRSIFLETCIFGPGTVFGTGCEFRQSCIFGAQCVFDSQAKFDLPCVFAESCIFGTKCTTAPNSYFESGCQFIDRRNCISVIAAKQEGKQDLISKLINEPKCSVCGVRNRSHILLPCMHIAVCKKCSKRDEIKKRGSCPVCRQTVQKIYEVRVD